MDGCFVSTGSPAFDFYDGQRLGQNLFGNSIARPAGQGNRNENFGFAHQPLGKAA